MVIVTLLYNLWHLLGDRTTNLKFWIHPRYEILLYFTYFIHRILVITYTMVTCLWKNLNMKSNKKLLLYNITYIPVLLLNMVAINLHFFITFGQIIPSYSVLPNSFGQTKGCRTAFQQHFRKKITYNVFIIHKTQSLMNFCCVLNM